MKKRCYITWAGEHFQNDIFSPEKSDLVIAADGGYIFHKLHGIRTDILIGDFDSINCTPGNDYKNIIKLNPVKDETDMLCAIQTGIEHGFSEFHIFGGTGGRNDHTIANIQTLTWLAKNDFRGFLYSENEVMTVVYNSKIEFDKSFSGYISVFSIDTESINVTEKGLKYTVENYNMKNDFPVGVSNEFTGNDSFVSVENGTLLVIYPRQKNRNPF